mmetsp:Transcript_74134/g.239745  ORF Transcript_74134/g.239745 Transcript_74134/m.239745 type:complete len:222 (+) Transcript_74134:253-918(+)
MEALAHLRVQALQVAAGPRQLGLLALDVRVESRERGLAGRARPFAAWARLRRQQRDLGAGAAHLAAYAVDLGVKPINVREASKQGAAAFKTCVRANRRTPGVTQTPNGLPDAPDCHVQPLGIVSAIQRRAWCTSGCRPCTWLLLGRMHVGDLREGAAQLTVPLARHRTEAEQLGLGIIVGEATPLLELLTEVRELFSGVLQLDPHRTARMRGGILLVHDSR